MTTIKHTLAFLIMVSLLVVGCKKDPDFPPIKESICQAWLWNEEKYGNITWTRANKIPWLVSDETMKPELFGDEGPFAS